MYHLVAPNSCKSEKKSPKRFQKFPQLHHFVTRILYLSYFFRIKIHRSIWSRIVLNVFQKNFNTPRVLVISCFLAEKVEFSITVTCGLLDVLFCPFSLFLWKFLLKIVSLISNLYWIFFQTYPNKCVLLDFQANLSLKLWGP